MLTAYLQCVFQTGDERYLLHSLAHKESMQSTPTSDIKWHQMQRIVIQQPGTAEGQGDYFYCKKGSKRSLSQ